MTILLDKPLAVRVGQSQIDLQTPKVMRSGSLGWGGEGILLAPNRSGSPASPGAVDTGDWMGCGVGAPFIFEDGGTFYMYFTSYKYYSDEWLPSIGVATASALAGAYSVHGAGPKLEKSGSSWYSHGLFGCSVYDNPNAGGSEQLNLTGDFSIEMIVYIESGITSDLHLMSHVDSGDTEKWKLRLVYTSGSLRLRAAIKNSAWWMETAASSSMAPAQGELVYIGMSFSYDLNRISCFIGNNLGGDPAAVESAFNPTTDVHSTTGGRLLFLNDLAGTSYNSGVHIYSLRIRDSFMWVESFQDAEPDTLANGLDTGESNVIFGCNFDEANYEFPADELNYGGLRGLGTGLAWADNKGMSADANGDNLEMLEVPAESYIMAVSGMNLAGGVHRSSIGYAYSNSLTSGWTVYEPPFQRASSLITAISDPYITGRNKRLYGLQYPRLYIDGDGAYWMICSIEAADQEWMLMGQVLNHLHKCPFYFQVFRAGTQRYGGSVANFDYLGVPSGFVLDGVITIGGTDYAQTVLYTGDTVVDNKYRFNIATTGRN